MASLREHNAKKMTDLTDLLRWVLPLYFLVFFGVAFVLKSVVVAKRIGKSPLVLPKDDSAYGLIGFYFKLVLAAVFVYVMVHALFPDWHDYFAPIANLSEPILQYMGLALLFVSLVWTVIAQGQMKDSWRIGIDTGTKTELVTGGLFALSRNPIFLGMVLSLAGLFLATPNMLTILFLVTGYMLIQTQIRLEEEFLAHAHGQKYLNYKRKVRRLL